MSPAPVVVFAFNRPDKLEGLLSSLEDCVEFATTPLFIFIDGPRNAADCAKVEEVIDLARIKARKNATITIHEENLGLKKSILVGVTQVLSIHDRAIILEDDLIISPTSLSYFNQALERFQLDDRVWSISGYMYEVPSLANRDEAIFLPFPNPWGWATWNTAWHKFLDVMAAAELPSVPHELKQSFDVNGIRDFTSILSLDQRGLISSWFINFYYAMFCNGGVSLWPPRSLISNQGVADGTHASALNLNRLLPRAEVSATYLPKLPTETHVDFGALNAIRNSRDVKVQKAISMLGAIKRRAKSALGGAL